MSYEYVKGLGDTITCDKCNDIVENWYSNEYHAVCGDCRFPERINAIKCISYDVESILDAMTTLDYKVKEEITIEDMLEWIEDDVQADFNGSNNYVFQDENGREL